MNGTRTIHAINFLFDTNIIVTKDLNPFRSFLYLNQLHKLKSLSLLIEYFICHQQKWWECLPVLNNIMCNTITSRIFTLLIWITISPIINIMQIAMWKDLFKLIGFNWFLSICKKCQSIWQPSCSYGNKIHNNRTYVHTPRTNGMINEHQVIKAVHQGIRCSANKPQESILYGEYIAMFHGERR